MVEYNVKQIKCPRQTGVGDFVIVEFPIEEKKNDLFRPKTFSRLKIIKAAPVNPGGQNRDEKNIGKDQIPRNYFRNPAYKFSQGEAWPQRSDRNVKNTRITKSTRTLL